MNLEILEILHVMEIPVWIPKNRKLPIQSTQTSIIPISTNARYALILGCVGQWDAQTPAIKEDQFNMLKRLILALNWNFDSCMIGEVNLEQAQMELVNTVKQSNLEKMIVFGNNVEKLVEILGTQFLEVIVIPSVEDLMRDPMAKREAWGRLLPHKIL